MDSIRENFKNMFALIRRGQFREFYHQYEALVSPTFFIAGFIGDNLTLTRIDLLIDNLLLVFHLTTALISITLFNMYDAGRLRGRIAEKYAPYLPLVMQFAFGNLFSGFFVFYSRSASLVSSWPFILFLLFLFIGNETFRSRYSRLTFQLSIFFIALFSYMIFSVPIIVGAMGAGVFLLSGGIALAVTALVVYLIHFFLPHRTRESKRFILASLGALYLAFNVLYFTNIIPPIPLSLKAVGVYHDVERADGDYVVEYEKTPWYVFWKRESHTLHIVPGEPVYTFASVFAPTRIRTSIYHEWQYYDERAGEWVLESRLSYPISGGRGGGYRGFTFKRSLEPGKWRVDVVTDRGQLLGRVHFTIEETLEAPETATRVK